MDIAHRFDYGITAGAGIEFRIKKTHGIVLEGRYYYGLGVKTEESDKKITRDFVEEHVLIGVEALKLIIDKRTTVKHLRFDEE